jgi:hypothetical protein
LRACACASACPTAGHGAPAEHLDGPRARRTRRLRGGPRSSGSGAESSCPRQIWGRRWEKWWWSAAALSTGSGSGALEKGEEGNELGFPFPGGFGVLCPARIVFGRRIVRIRLRLAEGSAQGGQSGEVYFGCLAQFQFAVCPITAHDDFCFQKNYLIS